MRIEKTALDAQNRCVYSLYKEKGCIGHAVTCADCFEALEIAPEWQSRGYGSYLLREVLRQNGGFDRTAPSEFTAPLPDAGNTAAQALAANQIPFELHVYPFGEHGLATSDDQTIDNPSAVHAYDRAWLPAAKKWLRVMLSPVRG